VGAARRPSAAAVAAVVLLAVAVYLPALRNGFVWDDTALVLRDPLIRSWHLAPEGTRHFLFTDATASAFFRPVQRLTYTADHSLWGFAPAGYHLTNLLLHAGAAAGLLFLLSAWIGPGPGATIAAAAWALLPTHSSAVIYVAGRADPLAALFGFWGLFCAVRGRWIPAALLLVLAGASKEHGLLFLALLPVFGRSPGGWRDRAGWCGLAVAGALVLAILRFGATGPRPPDASPDRSVPRAEIAARAVAEYAGLLLAPANLRMERDVVVRPRPGRDEAGVAAERSLRKWQGALGLALLCGAGVWFARSGPAVRGLLAAGAILYLPVSGLVPLNANVAEHWLYLPSGFFLAAAVASISRPWILLPWMAYCAAVTFGRCGDWRDQRTFLERTIAAGGDSARMWLNLGNAEAEAGDFARAAACYAGAREREPDLALADLAEANASLRAGRIDVARRLFLRAGRDPFLRPSALAGVALADYAGGAGDPLGTIETACRASGRAWNFEKFRVRLLRERGENAAAIASLRSLLERDWWRGESWALLEEVLREAGREEEAVRAAANARRFGGYSRPAAG
jgi:tetratricopeptide (TPR) repeat protein